jgi:hypothetical protein
MSDTAAMQGIFTNDDKCSQIDFNLPVNTVDSIEVYIAFTSPKGFYMVEDHYNEFISGKSNILEFAPANTTVNNWSKIFTVISIVGKSISSEDLINFYSKKYANPEFETFHVISDTKKYDNYSVSTALIQYALEGQNEIIYAQYFSGPRDAAGVQYTERLSNSLTSEEFDIKVGEMQNFFDGDVLIEVLECSY